jgi:selenocysteine lyase/cysteine desulfurase
MDVQDWGCDALACSAYKFFGPHVGILWARRELLEELPAYKVRPVPDVLPDRWMTGTQNHEGLAGVVAALDYLAGIGARYPAFEPAFPELTGKRLQIHAGLAAIQAYERDLGKKLLEGLALRPRFRIWGVTRPDQLHQRVPTVSFTLPGRTADQIAEQLADKQINVWNGNMYALKLTERLGLEAAGGFVRLGLVHYNTAEEVERVLSALDEC